MVSGAPALQLPVAAGTSIDDCFRIDTPRITHDAALASIRARICPTSLVERLTLYAGVGRYLAETIIAAAPVPAHTNSAVDGFAYANVAHTTADTFAIVGRAAAGHPFDATVPAGPVAVRILTGAALPTGTDTVAMREDCDVVAGDPARVTIPAGQTPGTNVRRAGEDVAVGVAVLQAGHRLRAQDLAALAALGLADVDVRARPRVAIVATGDEVRAPGSGALATANVYDANSAMLAALVAAAGGDVTHLGIWPDRREIITARLAAAADTFDVILTTGGASMGDEDHIAASVADLGHSHFWQIAVKPGRPLLFGQIDRGDRRCLVVGLPGNPVAVFVCGALYVQPMLRALQGGRAIEPRRMLLPAAFAFTGRKRGRREFWRGILVDTPTGLAVDKFKRDGSGLISGLVAADGLIDIAEDAGDVAIGDPVDFIALSEFGIDRA